MKRVTFAETKLSRSYNKSGRRFETFGVVSTNFGSDWPYSADQKGSYRYIGYDCSTRIISRGNQIGVPRYFLELS